MAKAIGVCEACKREITRSMTGTTNTEVVPLSEGMLCASCARRLRAKYPFEIIGTEMWYQGSTYDRKTDTWDAEYSSPYEKRDPLCELTPEEAIAELAGMDAFKAKLRKSFGGRENVFEVTQVVPMPKLKPFEVGILNVRKYKGAVVVAGRVHLGCFHKGDMVDICHGSETLSATVLTAQCNWAAFYSSRISKRTPLDAYCRNVKEYPLRDRHLSSDAAGVSEGYQATLILTPEAQGVGVGDRVYYD